MSNDIESVKIEIVERIRKEFILQFDANNRLFARSVGCNEKTIRDIFNYNHGITLNLFLKLSKALKIAPSKLLEGINFDDESPL